MGQKINVPSLSGENGFDIAKLWCCGSLSCNNWEWLLRCDGYESKMGTLSFIFMKRNFQVKVITLKTQYIIDQSHTPSTYLYSVPWIVYQLISNLNLNYHNPACFSWASCNIQTALNGLIIDVTHYQIRIHYFIRLEPYWVCGGLLLGPKHQNGVRGGEYQWFSIKTGSCCNTTVLIKYNFQCGSG